MYSDANNEIPAKLNVKGNINAPFIEQLLLVKRKKKLPMTRPRKNWFLTTKTKN